MTNVYYQVIDGPVLDFCRDFRARRSAVRETFIAFSESHGAEGFMEAWGRLWGLIFPYGATIAAGWKVEKRKTSDGRTIHSPNKKTDAGKALKMAIDGLDREPSSDEFCARFDIPRSLRYARPGDAGNYGSMCLTSIFPNTAFVAWTDAGDSFWIVLPDIAKTIAEKVAEGYVCEPPAWTSPDGIVRSSRARYDLAVAAAKVADEELEVAA